MAIKQGHTQLKFANEKGIKLSDSDWIAGVDCEDDPHNKIETAEDEDSDSSDDNHAPDL